MLIHSIYLNSSSTNLYSSRSHCEYNRYSLSVGEAGEDIVREATLDILVDYNLPYMVNLDHRIQSNGPDMVIMNVNTRKRIGLFEINNLNKGSYITAKRAKNIRDNLRGARYKGLITTFPETIPPDAKRILKNTPIVCLGFQILPEWVYQEIDKNEKSYRKLDSIETLGLVKDLLSTFFVEIGLIPLVYQDINNSHSLHPSSPLEERYVDQPIDNTTGSSQDIMCQR